jgi:hypothetical protein
LIPLATSFSAYEGPMPLILMIFVNKPPSGY